MLEKLKIDNETTERVFIFSEYPNIPFSIKDINLDFIHETFNYEILEEGKRLKNVELFNILEKLKSNFHIFIDFSKLFMTKCCNKFSQGLKKA